MCAPLTIYLRSTALITLLLCTLNLYYTVLIMLNKIQFNSIQIAHQTEFAVLHVSGSSPLIRYI